MSNSNRPEHPTVSRRNVVFGGAISAIAVVFAAACSDDGPQAGEEQVPTSVEPAAVADLPGAGQVVHVQSLDNTFRPQHIDVVAGTEVIWENRGRNDHDIVPLEGSDWGVAKTGFPPGSTYSHVFTDVGDVSYYCSIHGTATAGMTGTLTVTG